MNLHSSDGSHVKMRLVSTSVCRFAKSEMHFGRLGKGFVSQESPGTSKFPRPCGQSTGRGDESAPRTPPPPPLHFRRDGREVLASEDECHYL